MTISYIYSEGMNLKKTKSVAWKNILSDSKCGSSDDKNTKVKDGNEEFEEKWFF